MVQRSETSRFQDHQVLETREPREPSYQFKRFFAFCLDGLYEAPLLKDTNFRINLHTLDRLRSHIGNEVDPLEKAIVENRWRSLRGLAAKIGGQTAMTAALSIGNLPPDSYLPLFGIIAAGDTLEGMDRDTGYQEVKAAAVPVMQSLVLGYSADIYDLPTSKKQILVRDMSEAVAKGESFARPELTTAVYTLLNVMTLFATGQTWIGTSLAAFELAVLTHIQRSLKSAGQQRQSMGEDETLVTDAMGKDAVFGTELVNDMLFSTSDVSSGERHLGNKLEKVIVQLITQFVLPALSIKIQGDIGLALAQSSQLITHLSPVHVNEREFAEAQAGLKQLKGILTLIEDNKMSLTRTESLAVFCQEERKKNLDAVEYTDSPDLNAVIGRFSVSYPNRSEPHLIMKDSLALKTGIYFLTGKGSGESEFLHALTQQTRTSHDVEKDVEKKKKEKGKESVIRLNNQLVRLHDLKPEDIQRLFMYVYPETSETKMSPLALFAKDVLASPSADPYIYDLIERYKRGDQLAQSERRAIGYGLQLLSGSKTEDQIKREVLKSSLPKEEKSVILQLLRYARNIEGAKERLEEKLKKYPAVFSEKDFKILKQFQPGKAVSKSLRAKLRIIKILEEAQETGTKIIAIDNTLDPINNEDTEIMLSFLEEWCKSHNVSMLIASTEAFNKNIILSSPMYQMSIFIHAPYIKTRRETPDKKVIAGNEEPIPDDEDEN